MKPLVTFAIAACFIALVQCTQVVREKTLKYQSGYRNAPNWKGSLICPIDYGINIENTRIKKNNRLIQYEPKNANDIRAKCTSRNSCDVEIWQKSSTDGKDIVIGYSCRSLLEPNLYPNKMVKRFYSKSDIAVTTYCNAGRVRRSGDVISRDWPSYSFDDLLAVRELYARAHVRGFAIEEYQPTSSNVFRTIITRTRRHADGHDITLPVYVASDLTSVRPSSQRGPFSKEVNQYLTRCGIRRGDDNADDGGHLVAYTLGGNDSPTNLVPMARDLNRIQGIWYRHEEEVRKFLRAHPAGKVTWEVLLVYSVRSEEPYRPISFILRYTKYEDRQNLNNGVVRLETFLNENEHYRNDQCTFNLDDFFRPAHQQPPEND